MNITLNCTCFQYEDNTIGYSTNTVLPSYISFVFVNDTYIQDIQVDFALATTALGSSFYLLHSNNLKSSIGNYYTSFSVTIYNCEDPNCVTCSYDAIHLSTGSKVCTQCVSGLTWNNTLKSCVNCGNGKVEKNETCDDGANGGCKSDCTASNTNFTCSGGSFTTPSVCVC